MVWSREPDRYRGVPHVQAERIRLRDNWICQECGSAGHEVDHIVNRANRGSDDDANLQVLCSVHHQAKTQREAAEGNALRRARLRLPVEPHPGAVARQRVQGSPVTAMNLPQL